MTKPFKILLVDDFRVSNEVTADGLSTLGYEVHSVQNVESALKLASTIQFDMVITDYNMPKSNGIELVQKLRIDPKYERIPIFMLSSVRDQAIKEKAYEAKITAWIKKPVDMQLMINMINKAFRNA